MNVSFRHDSLLISADPAGNFTLFDYNLYREIKDSTNNYKICRKFITSILEKNFEGFSNYANEEMRKGTFNEEFLTSLINFWGKVISHDGQYISSNIFETVVKPYGTDYNMAHHFEKSEMIMQLSFDEHGLINGFFILKVLPRCNVKTVNLIQVNKDEYFVDGFRYGGFKDFNVKYDSKSRSLNFKSVDGNYTALRTDNQF
jgi:hypothetical protein